MSFSVSVITPVYNAAKYVTNAVESAIHLPEVGEIILIEDRSPDNSLEVCIGLKNKYDKVKLLQHSGAENKGAGASRNLGIQNAKCEFIAFLDADDYYLSNRFEGLKELFESDNTIDGIYGAAGYFFENENREDKDNLTTLKDIVNHKDLLFTLLTPERGFFHTNAITVKRDFLLKTGLFDATLRLHQDTHLWLKMAYMGKLMPFNITCPTAMRRVHDENRIKGISFKTKKVLHIKTYEWFKNKENVDKRAFRRIFYYYIRAISNKNKITGMFQRLKTFMTEPGIIKKLI